MPQRLPLPCDCPHCHAPRSVERPSGAWKAALVLGYVTLAAMGVGMGLMGIAGPFVVLPVVVLYALGTLPWLHAHASAPATCRACDKIVEPQAEPAAPAGARPLALVTPHHAPQPAPKVPPVIASALAGAAVVGTSGALLVELVISPLSGHIFSASELWFVTMLGGVFGLVAGSVAGASEGEPEAEPATPHPIAPPADEPMPLPRSA